DQPVHILGKNGEMTNASHEAPLIHVPEALNAFGGGLITWPPVDVTRSTARPRWFVPSGRKRNTPSMPPNPDELVTVSSENRALACWVLARAETSATAS